MEATWNSVKRLALIGGEATLVVTPADFLCGGENASETDTFSGITATPCAGIIVSNTGNTISVYPCKHKRSTSIADDAANGHYNTATDDIYSGDWKVTGTITRAGAGVYNFDVNGKYFASINPPNISISRLAAVLGSGSNTLGGNSTASQINPFSFYKPNKVAPHGFGEFIKYAHSAINSLYATMIVGDSINFSYNKSSVDIKYYLLKMAVYDAAFNTVNICDLQSVSMANVSYKQGVVTIARYTGGKSLKIVANGVNIYLRQVTGIVEQPPYSITSSIIYNNGGNSYTYRISYTLTGGGDVVYVRFRTTYMSSITYVIAGTTAWSQPVGAGIETSKTFVDLSVIHGMPNGDYMAKSIECCVYVDAACTILVHSYTWTYEF